MSEPQQEDPCPPPDVRQGTPRVSPDVIGDDGTWPMPPGSGPCRTWPLEPGCGCLAPGSTDSSWGGAASWTDAQTHAVEVATEILWRLTAGRFGLCLETVRPCRACTCDPCRDGRYGPHPDIIDGQWRNLTCSRHDDSGRCGCPDTPEIPLPGPVYWEPLARPPDWTQQYRPADKNPAMPDASPRYRLIVWQDGKVLREPGWPLEWEPGDPIPPTYTPAQGDYWLLGDRLLRTDGQPWPATQDLSRPLQAREQYPDEALGTFGVQYWRGQPVPKGGRRAIAVLSCELWKACVGDNTCRLSPYVQSRTRSGIQEQYVDMTDYISQGRTGIREVDLWLVTVNPRGQRSPSSVWSPDLPRARSEWSTGGRITG